MLQSNAWNVTYLFEDSSIGLWLIFLSKKLAGPETELIGPTHSGGAQHALHCGDAIAHEACVQLAR